MAKRNRKVIGYFAFIPPGEVVCTDGNACVISGSAGAMKKFIMEMDPNGQKKHIIKKTLFEEIMSGLKLGAAYAFDEESYEKFYPLARQKKINVAKADFDEMKPKGFRFFIVQLKGV